MQTVSEAKLKLIKENVYVNARCFYGYIYVFASIY